MRISMLTVTFFAIMVLSLIGFSFTSMIQLLGMIAYAFGAHLPDWKTTVKYWQWCGIALVVSGLGFFVCKGLAV